jgi:undecaprenyl phosphate N,N'-diacetylbacillosamine 1-phosphate transferase
MYKKYIKRLLDIVVSLTAIVILLPVYLIVSLLILIFMGRPIFFKQQRVGKDEKLFNIYKFRTMTNKKDENGNFLPDDQRLTGFGKFLRTSSLDELPEFFMILFGKMSLVGPRPLLVEYLPYYKDKERIRYEVRPGITGLAQIGGRNLLSWDERFKLDVKYVENMSFLEDIRIFFKTIKKVMSREDLVVCTNCAEVRDLDQERKMQKDYFLRLTPRLFNKHQSGIKKCLLQLNGDNLEDTKRIIENMKNYLLDGTAIIYVYLADDNINGFVWAYEITKNTLHINYFVVNKDYRNKKIGTKLLNEIINESQGKNLELLVEKVNEKAIKFYEKNGFKTMPHSDKKYKMKRDV